MAPATPNLRHCAPPQRDKRRSCRRWPPECSVWVAGEQRKILVVAGLVHASEAPTATQVTRKCGILFCVLVTERKTIRAFWTRLFSGHSCSTCFHQINTTLQLWNCETLKTLVIWWRNWQSAENECKVKQITFCVWHLTWEFERPTIQARYRWVLCKYFLLAKGKAGHGPHRLFVLGELWYCTRHVWWMD